MMALDSFVEPAWTVRIHLLSVSNINMTYFVDISLRNQQALSGDSAELSGRNLRSDKVIALAHQKI